MSLSQGLCLLTAAFAAQEPPLVDAPQGWRHERLEFPLGFAPELAYRGFEDLSFAPGMFDAASDSYFSYALALRLEGDVAVDEAMLARFLELYYGGLYQAVASEKHQDTKGKVTTASARRDGEHWRASVKTFDAFTTGAALALDLELEVHCTPRATELLGLASPKPAASPIWKELHALRDAWRSKRPAPVFLNHVYAVVDRATYDALAKSSFLREQLAVSEERTTKRADTSYSGLYFYGTRTYVEFLSPDPAAGLAEGAAGVAFGVESSGGLRAWAQRLESAGVPSVERTTTRELDGVQLPWFLMLGVELPPSSLNVFALEYEPAFLERWHGDLPPSWGGIARASVLERYAASLAKSELRTKAPFADVVGIELATNDATRARLVDACKAAGHEVLAQGKSVTILGPQFRLTLQDAKGREGLLALELGLRQELRREAIACGRASLSFLGPTARIELGGK